MDNTEAGSSGIVSGITSRARSVFDAISGRAKTFADAGRQKVADRRDTHKRNALLRDLGQLYYEALSAGKEAPSAALRDALVADLKALEVIDLGADEGESAKGETADKDSVDA